jgi:hypothetical protein
MTSSILTELFGIRRQAGCMPAAMYIMLPVAGDWPNASVAFGQPLSISEAPLLGGAVGPIPLPVDDEG